MSRYHLLIGSGKLSGSISMSALRKKSLILVWIATLGQTVIQALSAQMYLAKHGWPHVSIEDLGREEVVFATMTSLAFINILDLASLVIYIKMWKFFRSAKVGPDIKPEDSIQIEEAHGGIWVGEEDFSDHSMREEAVTDSEEGQQQPEQQQQQQQDHESKSVLKALGWHIKLAMLDVLFGLLMWISCPSDHILRLLYIAFVAITYWVPLLVIVKAFKQLGGILGYIRTFLMA